MKKILILLLFTSLSYAQGIKTIAYPMTFNASTTSDTLDLSGYMTNGYRIAGIQCDSSNAGTLITLKVSANNINHGDLKDIDGTTVGAFTVTANNENVFYMRPSDAVGINSVYLVSNQTETCNVFLILWKQE